MPFLYSVDLRNRIIAYIQGGGQKKQACKLFDVDHNTVYRWLRQLRDQGHLKPKHRAKAKTRKIDEHKLENYLRSNPNKTLKQLAQEFKVSAWGIASKNLIRSSISSFKIIY